MVLCRVVPTLYPFLLVELFSTIDYNHFPYFHEKKNRNLYSIWSKHKSTIVAIIVISIFSYMASKKCFLRVNIVCAECAAHTVHTKNIPNWEYHPTI